MTYVDYVRRDELIKDAQDGVRRNEKKVGAYYYSHNEYLYEQNMAALNKYSQHTVLSLTSPRKYKSFVNKNIIPAPIATYGPLLTIPAGLLMLDFDLSELMFSIFFAFVFGVFLSAVEILSINSIRDYFSPTKLKLKKDTKNFLKNNSVLPDLYKKWKKGNPSEKEVIEEIWGKTVNDEWEVFVMPYKALKKVELDNAKNSREKIVKEIESIRSEKNPTLPILKEINSNNH